MTKAELDYGRALATETNSILAGLDSTKIYDAVNWSHLGRTAVEKVKIFSGDTTSIEWRVLRRPATLSESLVVACPRGCPTKWTKVEAVIVAAVLIEEASPDAYEFRTLVAQQLARRGYSGVAVGTQWKPRVG
jgi:hypothetical protein